MGQFSGFCIAFAVSITVLSPTYTDRGYSSPTSNVLGTFLFVFSLQVCSTNAGASTVAEEGYTSQPW